MTNKPMPLWLAAIVWTVLGILGWVLLIAFFEGLGQIWKWIT